MAASAVEELGHDVDRMKRKSFAPGSYRKRLFRWFEHEWGRLTISPSTRSCIIVWRVIFFLVNIEKDVGL